MKPFSLSKFTSIVSILFVTLSGMSAMGKGATTPPPPAGANGGYDPVQSTQLQNTQANKVACTAAIRELGAAITSAKQTCSAAKMTSKGKGVSFNCTSAIEQCEESTSFELPFGLSSTGLGLTSGVGEDCRAYDEFLTASEHSSEKEKARTRVETAERDSEDAKKRAEDINKDYQQNVTDIQKATQELLKRVKEDKRAREASEMEEQAKNKQTESAINKQVRETENRIMEIQKLQFKLPSDRMQQINGYKAKLLQCDLDARIASAKMKKERYISNSLSRASMGGNARGREIIDSYDTCVQAVLIQRTAEGEIHKANEAQLAKALTDTQAELKEAKEARALFQTQKQQKLEKDARNQLEDSESNLAEYNELIRQQKAMDGQKGMQVMNNMESQAKISARMNKASNELAKYENGPRPGGKNSADAEAAVVKIEVERDTCLSACAEVPSEIRKCDTGSSPSTRGTATTRGTDG